MNKSLLATIVSASLFLAGCSSSGDSSNGGPGDPVIPDIDNSPEWGLDIGDAPDWGLTDPDFGLSTPSIPDRLPPIWGGPEVPEIDNGPETSYTISGNTITDANGNVFNITDVNWHGQEMTVQDQEGNEYRVSVIRQGELEGDFGVVINGKPIIIGGDTVQGGPRPLMENSGQAIDRSAIRDSIRSHLK